MIAYLWRTLYDELLQVPLIIKLPGSVEGSSVIGTRVQSIDVAPTIV